MIPTQLIKTLHNAQNLELALETIQPCTTRTGCYVALFFGGALWGQTVAPRALRRSPIRQLLEQRGQQFPMCLRYKYDDWPLTHTDAVLWSLLVCLTG